MIQPLQTQPLDLFHAFVTELNEMCERYHMDIDTDLRGNLVVDAAPVHRSFEVGIPSSQRGQSDLFHIRLTRRHTEGRANG